jgi:CRP/FNR family transcriptional regulator, cyclic AMP receptor protein
MSGTKPGFNWEVAAVAQAKEYAPLLEVEEVLPILNRISILAGLSAKQLYSLFRLLQKVRYRKGETIFEEGDEPSHIYIVKSGEVKLVIDRERTPLELAAFEAGRCFGEASVIGIQRHAASAIAMEDTELIVLSRSALLSIYKTDLELFSLLILNIAREVCRRLHASDEILLHYFARNRRRFFYKSFFHKYLGWSLRLFQIMCNKYFRIFVYKIRQKCQI